MSNYINPEIAAHNIALAFCQHEIQNLPDSAFIPGNIQHSGTAAQQIWELYSKSLFKMLVADDTPWIIRLSALGDCGAG